MAMSHAATVIAFDFTCLTHLRSRVTEESLATEFLSAITAHARPLQRGCSSPCPIGETISPPDAVHAAVFGVRNDLALSSAQISRGHLRPLYARFPRLTQKPSKFCRCGNVFVPRHFWGSTPSTMLTAVLGLRATKGLAARRTAAPSTGSHNVCPYLFGLGSFACDAAGKRSDVVFRKLIQ
jgi:hypothetical protein